MSCKVRPDIMEAFPVILFYKYVRVADPHAFAKTQRALCSALTLKGRILIATEGINGTLAGPRSAIDQYIATLKNDVRFADIEFKVSGGDAGTFPKLVVKVRKEIVTLDCGEVQPDHDNQLSPSAWKQMMEENPDAVVLDIRNRYESAAGKFENAVVCDIEHFRELPAYVEQLESLKSKTRAHVLHGRHSLREGLGVTARARVRARLPIARRNHQLPGAVWKRALVRRMLRF